MFGADNSIYEHKEIVPECKGCKKIHKRLDGKLICRCHCFPNTKWWFDDKCSQATHIKQSYKENPYEGP